MTLIHLGDLIFNSENIAVVRPIDDDQCTIFMVGQSAIDSGFLVLMSAGEVEEELSKVDRNVLLDMAEQLREEIEDKGRKREKV